MIESERDRLRATAEQLLGQPKLDLFERETLEQIRMDRAERKARERGKTKGWTEVKIQKQAEKRRFWRGVGAKVRDVVEFGGKILISIGLKKAQAKIDRL